MKSPAEEVCNLAKETAKRFGVICYHTFFGRFISSRIFHMACLHVVVAHANAKLCFKLVFWPKKACQPFDLLTHENTRP